MESVLNPVGWWLLVAKCLIPSLLGVTGLVLMAYVAVKEGEE